MWPWSSQIADKKAARENGAKPIENVSEVEDGLRTENLAAKLKNDVRIYQILLKLFMSE